MHDRPRTNATVPLPPATAGQRIGLLGGSFNPAHEAHLLISETALKQLGLDRVWWLVTPGNPFKTDDEATAIEARVLEARHVANDRRIVVTDFEKHIGSHYTVETLHFLTSVRPGVHFVWLMGADSLAGFHKWRRWRSIFRIVPIAVIDRPGYGLKARASPAAQAFATARIPAGEARGLAGRRPPAWVFLSGPLSVQSSTKIRAARRGQLKTVK